MNKTIKNNDNKSTEKPQLPLVKANFILMAASALIVITGFLLMIGSGSNGEEFNPDIFSTRRIVIGPTIAFIGFVAMGVSIIYRPRHRD